MKKLGTLLVILAVFLFSKTFAISQEYYPNYKIDKPWNEIIQLLTKIEAYNGAWKTPPANIFSTLNKDFKTVFNYFPSDPNYKIVYEQCLLTTESLVGWVNYDKYLIFRDRCFDSLNKILKEIGKKYTVKADIKANPQSGSAPLSVTFDGRGSIDPSNDTIPTNNYLWYFKDSNWVTKSIGQWPVVNYTFNQPWNYVVHLTVRSVNSTTKWIFDGEWSIAVNVWPRSAIISAYVNNKRLREDVKAKVWTQEAKKWLNFDWSWTYPTWGRKIIYYKWEITWWDWFNYVRSWRDNPWSFRLQIPANWEYNVKLSITDNENNTISETYSMIVSDPIATIKYSPTQWNTLNTYSFDASLSYSIQSSLKSYKWTVFDPNGTQIESFEWKTFQRKFILPWNYTAKLTIVDDLWNTNEDQIKFYVDSSAPIPQFLVKPMSNWKHPSQFILDAVSTYDYDAMNWTDAIKYEWRISDKSAKIERSFDDGQKIIVSFDNPWTYKVKLIVTDRYNKISEIEKEIDVVSSLRPEINVSPLTSNWWDEVTLTVTSNKPISNYVWDFGDGTTLNSSSSAVNHVYKKSWVYAVKLTARTQGGEENEVVTNVFVWEKWFPIAAYNLKVWERTLSPDDICVDKSSGQTVDYIAYSLDRYQEFLIDATPSVNTKWTNDNIKINFKPQNDQIYNWTQLNYKFTEIGCQYVEIWAEDTSAKVTDKAKVWVKVKNALPTMQNLTLTFPQYWNEAWIWFGQNNQNKDMFAVEYDPLVVKPIVNWAKDTDGFISHYMWYYYKTDDPSRILELKITPVNVPYSVFAMPRVPWSYTFWVKIIDNDGWEISSEQVLGKGPTVFFPPDTKNLDIPMVTLKTSKVNVKVWEDVKFRVIAKTLSNRDDFASNRIIKYDFDWDGEYDLTTKKDEVLFRYEKEWKFTPKVKVVYRGYGWIGYGEVVEVKKWLRTELMSSTFWNKVLVRNNVYWEVESSQLCIDMRKCDESKYVFKNQDFLVYEYETPWKYIIKANVQDKYWNEETSKVLVDVKSTKETLWLMSVPNATLSKTWYQIEIWKNLNNSVLYYVASSVSWDCYLDTDITQDSDNDWSPDQDKDLKCNEAKLQSYSPSAWSTIARIYYKDGWKTVTKDITITFIDYDMKLTAEQQQIYEELNNIIDKIVPEGDLAFFKTLLINLRNSLWDKTEQESTIIQIKQYMDENQSNKDIQSLSPEVNKILEKLIDKSTKAALGWTPYDSAKADILMFIPSDSKAEVERLFSEIEWSWGNKDKIKENLQQIINIAEKAIQAKKMDESSLPIIKNDVCEILKYYEVPSKACWTDNTSEVKTTQSSSVLWTVLKVLWAILLVVLVAFWWLIVVFAIRAKKQQKDWWDTTPKV